MEGWLRLHNVKQGMRLHSVNSGMFLRSVLLNQVTRLRVQPLVKEVRRKVEAVQGDGGMGIPLLLDPGRAPAPRCSDQRNDVSPWSKRNQPDQSRFHPRLS